MAKPKIASRKGRGHIRRMTDDIKTLREAGQAITGLRREFGYFKWYLAGIVAVMAAGFYLLHSQAGDVSKQLAEISKTLSRMEGKMEATEKRSSVTPLRTPAFTMDKQPDSAVEQWSGTSAKDPLPSPRPAR